jgi:HD-GYP domain-containing protein (c-di-GMP phosphodiesterase class II)
MEQTSNKVIRERFFTFLLAMAALYTFLLSLRSVEWMNIRFQVYILVLLFAGSIIIADQYRIHLLRGTKATLINLPIFLSTALLPVPLAVFATGAGLLVANLLTRVDRGLFPRDIVSTVSQWMLTVYLGYQILQLDLSGLHAVVSRLELLLLCGFSFLLIDLSLFSISQSSVYEEPFISILKSVVKQGISIEVIQYLIATLGILASDQDPWSLILLLVPIVITYVAFKNIKETRYETVRVLKEMANTVDLRDVCTGGHSKQVMDLVHQLLAKLNISGPEATLIEISASLHDIGKIGIPDRILLKSGTLSPEERAIMQTHSQKGAELISQYKDFVRGAAMILHHHERWDGKGYPSGLKEYEIPFGSRVIAVADSFEAMTSDRPYRKALSIHQAIQILLEGRGKQWDPIIVNAFVDLVIKQMDEKTTEGLCRLQVDSAPSQAMLTSSQDSLGV